MKQTRSSRTFPAVTASRTGARRTARSTRRSRTSPLPPAIPYTMMWSTDTIDWKPVADGGPTAAQVASRVLAGRTAGAVVLMHLGGYNTRNALFTMIKRLREARDTPTTVSALYRTGH